MLALTRRIGPAKHAVLAADATGQLDAHIVAAGIWANEVLEAAIGELQRILVEAALRLAAKRIQVAEMKAKVAHMVGRYEHVNLNRAATDVALDYNPSAKLAAELVGPWRV